jgi:hypothetical protein
VLLDSFRKSNPNFERAKPTLEQYNSYSLVGVGYYALAD